ncbi:hypothetical protein HYT04_01345 [Candidatus Kaiserbacteria bacterium]|nr:hypothetical protein [Candidatus Kaiserbacteria bacterium]
MERETIKTKTPSGKELELKAWLTARERNELRRVFLEGVSIDPNRKDANLKDLSGDVLEKAEHKYVEIVVAKYDGSNERVLERLLDASPAEYDFAVAEAGKIDKGNFTQAK